LSAFVLDASVLVATLSPAEIHHREARRLFDSVPERQAFLVPSIFRVEVLAAMARRGEPEDVLDTVDALVSGPRFYAHPINDDLMDRAVVVARRARVRAYDALYAGLALLQAAALLTLDGDVVQRLSVSFPELKVVSSPGDDANPQPLSARASRRRTNRP